METNNSDIARWEQRLLRGKLHLPYFTSLVVHTPDGKMDLEASLATMEQKPKCGRQLNNRRAERSQLADKIEFASSVEEFTYQLLSGKGCRHCAKASGILVTPAYSEEEGEDGED